MLSKKCQYALHALKFISQQSPDKRLKTQMIADSQKIPKKFLEIILYDLKIARILDSRKGKFGGYSMARHPSEISVLEVIRVIDGAVALLPCVSLNFYRSCGRCEDESTCGLNSIFSSVRDETLKILSTTSIMNL